MVHELLGDDTREAVALGEQWALRLQLEALHRAETKHARTHPPECSRATDDRLN
jgi:hypothetical protein